MNQLTEEAIWNEMTDEEKWGMVQEMKFQHQQTRYFFKNEIVQVIKSLESPVRHGLTDRHVCDRLRHLMDLL